MKRYVVLYHAPLSVAARFAQATPEQAEQGAQLWIDWARRIGTALVDPGKPLGNAHRVTQAEITRADSTIIGMSILRAATINDALGMVRDHHHLSWAPECEVTILEEQPIPELQ
ncbi:hypothetical protein ABIA39_002170 [Nocardia sp. GAS34]|uniref:hypothetical protein n=1 Tax=unclassified Nocardia TaxID=2637762 RepID=UPI003D19C240